MENPNKIEIEGLKTIHKLCNFGAEHDMEGCSFTEIVERMFSKIKSMQTQVNTLDEMLLNQGDALAEAKAQAVPEWAVIVPKLSANYLFNTVPDLGFKQQDLKDTVLYHLNYMALEFRDSAKQFVEDDHAKQKAMIEAQGQKG